MDEAMLVSDGDGDGDLEALVAVVYDLQVQHARLVQHLAGRHGLNPLDMRTLMFLGSARAPATPKDIGADLQIGTGTVTAMLDRMEARGLLHRERNPRDRRSSIVRLNATGQAVVDDLRNSYRVALAAAVDPRDRAVLVAAAASLAEQRGFLAR